MKKTHKKKLCFLQDWGSYSNQTLVCVAMTYDEITRKLRCFGKDRTVDWLKDEKLLKDRMESATGLFWFVEGRSVLWMPEFKDDWRYYNTLMHELFHAVFNILGSGKGMHKEEEALAYQQEFLFTEIRRRLQKHYDH